MRRASPMENYKIGQMLQEVAKRDEEGKCVYTGNWDEASIAKKLGVSVFSVTHLRKQMFGELRSARPPTAKLTPRVEALEKAAKDQENTNCNAEARLDALEKWAKGKGFTTPNGRMQAILKPFSHP